MSETKLPKKLPEFTTEDQLRANVFYERNLHWQKEVETDILYKKIMSQREQLIRNKIPKNYFKPKTNKDKNEKLVKQTFEERIKDYHRNRDKSLKKISQEMYHYNFTPQKYSKTNNKSPL